jgi:hypothetical protein
MKKPHFLVFLFAAIIPAMAGPIQNGSFDTNPANPANLSPWQISGTTAGLSVARSSTDFTSAPLGLRVTGRGAATDGPVQQQNLLGALTNGATYVTRCRIKLDAPAQVRVLLYVASSIAQPPFILAEKVVRSSETGQWLSLEGIQKIAWTGTPSAARIYFAVEQIYPGSAPAGAFPSYSLDDLFMEPDNDGDGLSNAEETGTNPNAKDSDGDTLPDKWELANGLNPGDSADAALDPDQDGHSNLIEYWACTDPHSAVSYPGITCDPQASTATRALLYYLQTRGARELGQYLSGQHAQFIADGDYTVYVAGLNSLMSAAGFPSWVSVLGIAAEGPSAQEPMQIAISGPVGRAYMDAGGLVVLHWTPRNPWTLGFPGDHTGVNIPNLLTPGSSANVTMLAWMDGIAAELALFGDNRPVIFRPLSEQNGGWNWYGRLQQADFIALYRWMRDYFVNAKGLHNILWTIEEHLGAHRPAGTGNAGVSMDYYYPGDDVIDLVGFSNYVSGWNPGFDADAQSRLHAKAFAITEGGPPSSEDDAANAYNATYLNALDAWFPRSAFFVIWNSFPNGSHLAIRDNPNYVELLTDARVTNREQVNFLRTAAAWQAAHGILNQPLTADPDMDGLTNLLEAAGGGDPLQPGAAALALSIVSVAGQSYHALTFVRDPSVADVTMTVQVSSDLSHWTDGSTYGPGGILPDTAATAEVSRFTTGGLETITVRSKTPSGASREFMRILVDGPR